MKITPVQYARALYEYTRGRHEKEELSDIVGVFAAIVRRNRDGRLFRKIISAFKDIFTEADGIITALVQTKISLSEQEKLKVERAITRIFGGKSSDIRYTENHGIKGGVVIKTKNKMIDASIAGKLKQLQAVLDK
ncbi:MAG: hypothetical protein COW88_01340 [Candidatus Lloydbacteria bacterium CG22_combo_CG10-13_8_21_14_all_47_15]|uniref:Uncharacterized protein n=1 Tax=Candidatus Lloydbacteria bacterium CG22_combo_CG10-13_8_21_14_all_47_15 TaxID=1974635 RepID=A0A2H0CUU7_9BACT|nr:MAG: hypothetical protein COW88_01340 [Candidatus Lloydbacteria bacterium CG22_combo_CG10-13_8_21_14_all_47_15]